MPYVNCSSCGASSFTAAYWYTVEHCARCGAELPRPRRQAFPASGAARFPARGPSDEPPRYPSRPR
ncbi:MAG: hypothetical protein QOH58_2128 [Thermoleophilaceae bacterium]|jgi:hypothetical protein|nr:hypothetical protein [Thermoleophilaceae bacterium]